MSPRPNWLVFYGRDSLFLNLSQWNLEALPNGRYKLSIGGSPTGELRKLLYAFLTGPETAEEWIITNRYSQYTWVVLDTSRETVVRTFFVESRRQTKALVGSRKQIWRTLRYDMLS